MPPGFTCQRSKWSSRRRKRFSNGSAAMLGDGGNHRRTRTRPWQRAHQLKPTYYAGHANMMGGKSTEESTKDSSSSSNIIKQTECPLFAYYYHSSSSAVGSSWCAWHQHAGIGRCTGEGRPHESNADQDTARTKVHGDLLPSVCRTMKLVPVSILLYGRCYSSCTGHRRFQPWKQASRICTVLLYTAAKWCEASAPGSCGTNKHPVYGRQQSSFPPPPRSQDSQRLQATALVLFAHIASGTRPTPLFSSTRAVLWRVGQ